MTSVPKPFKFLKVHYPTLMTLYEQSPDNAHKRSLADFLSVLSMTMAEQDQHISLKLLMQGTMKDFMNWGHEYLHHLAGDIGAEYTSKLENQQSTDDLIELVKQIIPQFISNNSEADAIDLLLEVDRLGDLIQYVNKDNFQRIFIYLMSCSLYSADADEMLTTLKTAFDICINEKQYTNALTIAIKLDDIEYIKKVVKSCQDP